MSTPHVVNELSHLELTSFLHDLNQSAYRELTRDGSGLISKLTIWTDSGKTLKVREISFTRDGTSHLLTQVVKKQYDVSGSVVETLTLTFTRDGSNKITNVTVART